MSGMSLLILLHRQTDLKKVERWCKEHFQRTSPSIAKHSNRIVRIVKVERLTFALEVFTALGVSLAVVGGPVVLCRAKTRPEALAKRVAKIEQEHSSNLHP